MYNLSNHYENIYHYLHTIITDPRVVYLHPFGSTQPENLEMLRGSDLPDKRNPPERIGPMFIFFDQEPLDFSYNSKLFDYFLNNNIGPFILISTERDGADGRAILEKYPFAHLDYFFHIFAAADWFRGHQFLPGNIDPKDRILKKSFITFNRLTSNKRIYRSLFVNELYKNNLLDAGYISYSKHCPDDGVFDINLRRGVPEYELDTALVEEAIANLSQLPDLRIDFPGQEIPNQSMLLTPMPQLMESFVFVVTETCYFQSKTHLTEKIFKPIVLRMPFLLLGCAHNLEYLRSYGFKTFGDFWDESYDSIEDPILRLQAVTEILKDIAQLSSEEQKAMLLEMQPILEHNYDLFNNGLVEKEWENLKEKLRLMCENYKFVPPYRLNGRLGQAIPVGPNES